MHVKLANPPTELRPGCPAWCDGTCQLTPGFHTRDIADLDVADADLLGDRSTVWAALETAGAGLPTIRLQLRPSKHHPIDRGLQLSADQAVELGRALVLAGIVAGWR